MSGTPGKLIRACIVPDCPSKRYLNTKSHKKFFSASNRVTQNLWIESINNACGTSLRNRATRFFVCQDHFADKAFYNKTSREVLYKNAVPTIFPKRPTNIDNMPSIESFETLDPLDISGCGNMETFQCETDASDNTTELITMPTRACAVHSCYYSAKTYHRFPNPKKYPQRFQEWLDFCANPTFQNLSAEAIFEGRRLCKNHFSEDSWVKDNVLSKTAVPSIYTGMLYEMWECCVKGCKDKTSVRHRFPNPIKKLDIFRKWVKLTKNPLLQNMDVDLVFENYRVCLSHFTQKDKLTRLFVDANAVPSLNLPTDDVEVVEIDDDDAAIVIPEKDPLLITNESDPLQQEPQIEIISANKTDKPEIGQYTKLLDVNKIKAKMNTMLNNTSIEEEISDLVLIPANSTNKETKQELSTHSMQHVSKRINDILKEASPILKEKITTGKQTTPESVKSVSKFMVPISKLMKPVSVDSIAVESSGSPNTEQLMPITKVLVPSSVVTKPVLTQSNPILNKEIPSHVKSISKILVPVSKLKNIMNQSASTLGKTKQFSVVKQNLPVLKKGNFVPNPKKSDTSVAKDSSITKIVRLNRQVNPPNLRNVVQKQNNFIKTLNTPSAAPDSIGEIVNDQQSISQPKLQSTRTHIPARRHNCLNICVLLENTLLTQNPREVCQKCLKQILRLHAFFTKTENVESKLKNLLSRTEEANKTYSLKRKADMLAETNPSPKRHKPVYAEDMEEEDVITVVQKCDSQTFREIKLKVKHTVKVTEEKCSQIDSGLANLSQPALQFVLENLPTGPPPFKCNVCGAEFLILDVWLQHFKEHAQMLDNPFKCAKCRDSFPSVYELNRHMCKNFTFVNAELNDQIEIFD